MSSSRTRARMPRRPPPRRRLLRGEPGAAARPGYLSFGLVLRRILRFDMRECFGRLSRGTSIFDTPDGLAFAVWVHGGSWFRRGLLARSSEVHLSSREPDRPSVRQAQSTALGRSALSVEPRREAESKSPYE